MIRNSIYTVYFSLFFFGISFLTKADIFDARTASLGFTSVCRISPYALFNGIANLSAQENKSVSSVFNIPYSISELSQSAFIYNHFTNDKTFAIGLSKSGNNTFQEESIILGAGLPFGNLKTGLSIELIQYNLEAHGRKIIPVVDIGSNISILPNLIYGIQINNLFQANLGELDPIESSIIIGISYPLSQKLNSFLEYKKGLYSEDDIGLGLAYTIHQNVLIDLGIRKSNLFPSTGIAIRNKRFKFHYGFLNDLNIGSSHFLSLSYAFKKETG